MSPHEARPESRQAAVIDVGSNSVRLVIYRLEGRAIWTVYNEKALAGLGREMAETGRLAADGVEIALSALRRFRAILQGWEPHEVVAVATAAVREAEDGPAFAERVRRELGLPLRVLSGEEEAYFAAAGVLAGHPGAPRANGPRGRVTPGSGPSWPSRTSSRLDPPRSPARPRAPGWPASTPAAAK